MAEHMPWNTGVARPHAFDTGNRHPPDLAFFDPNADNGFAPLDFDAWLGPQRVGPMDFAPLGPLAEPIPANQAQIPAMGGNHSREGSPPLAVDVSRADSPPIPVEVISLLDEDDEGGPYAMYPPRTMKHSSRPPTITGAECLLRVLDVLPGISHDYVLERYDRTSLDMDSPDFWMQAFIDGILDDGTYPTEKEAQRNLKRKRDSRSSEPEDEPLPASRKQYMTACRLLQDEFPDLLKTHVTSVVYRTRNMRQAYEKLAADNLAGRGRGSRKRRKPAQVAPPTLSITEPVSAAEPLEQRLQTQLDKARKKLAAQQELALREQAIVDAEEENERRAQELGTVQECGCCCVDRPINRMVECQDPRASPLHLICFNCIKTHVETEIGQSRSKILCIHVDGCTFTYANRHLETALPKTLLIKLHRMQQEEEVRAAKLDGLEECPFCDFMAVCIPKEVDREFRCGKQECGIVSCRLCRLETHVPLNCEEHAKERGLDARHELEEAMTAALIRSCNRCKKQFIKESGCNKMTCVHCHNVQCYVCGEDVKNYHHFAGTDPADGLDGGGARKCPVNDNTVVRHQQDVKKAEEEARKKIREANPELSDEDLQIKMSQAVREAEARAARRPDAAFFADLVRPQFPPGYVQDINRVRRFRHAVMRPDGGVAFRGPPLPLDIELPLAAPMVQRAHGNDPLQPAQPVPPPHAQVQALPPAPDAQRPMEAAFGDFNEWWHARPENLPALAPQNYPELPPIPQRRRDYEFGNFDGFMLAREEQAAARGAQALPGQPQAVGEPGNGDFAGIAERLREMPLDGQVPVAHAPPGPLRGPQVARDDPVEGLGDRRGGLRALRRARVAQFHDDLARMFQGPPQPPRAPMDPLELAWHNDTQRPLVAPQPFNEIDARFLQRPEPDLWQPVPLRVPQLSIPEPFHNHVEAARVGAGTQVLSPIARPVSGQALGRRATLGILDMQARFEEQQGRVVAAQNERDRR